MDGRLPALRAAGRRVAGRLADGNARFLARADPADQDLAALLTEGDPAGHRVTAHSADGVNHVTLARA